jgi:hypothetical protein
LPKQHRFEESIFRREISGSRVLHAEGYRGMHLEAFARLRLAEKLVTSTAHC